MNFTNNNMLLYAVTDRNFETSDYTLENQLIDSLEGGATCVQLREKNANFNEFLDIAKKLKKVVRKYNVPFLINDNIEVALEVDADGVHIGQSDMKALDARNKLGENKIIGVTVKTVDEAIKAQKSGADYLGVGAMFSTKTKLDVLVIDYNEVKEICRAVSIPVVAIGGITYNNMDELKGLNLSGIALVSEIFGQENIKEHSKKLLEKSKQIFNNNKI